MRLRPALAVLLALLFACLLIQSPAHAQQSGVKCNRTAIYDASTSGSTLLITGISTQNVYI